MRLPYLLAAGLLCLVPAISAQRTWIVDRNGGQDFTTIPPAVAAAAPGDTILVRGGPYDDPLDIDKGLQLIGQNAVLEPAIFTQFDIDVHDLPANQRFVMRGFSAGNSGFGSMKLRAQDCGGAVVFRDLGQAALDQWGLSILDCDQVVVAGGVVIALRCERSNVVASGLAFDPPLFGGFSIDGGEVDCVGCTVRGSLNVFPGPGITLTSGRVRISQSSVTGTGSSPGIDSSGGTILLDSSVTITGTPPISGPATVIQRDFGSLLADSDGSQLTAHLHGPTTFSFALLLSLVSPTLDTPFSQLWVSTEHNLVLDFGTFNTSRRHRYQLTHPAFPPGLAATLQPVLFQTTFELGTPTIVVFP